MTAFMHDSERWVTAAERTCLTIYLIWLACLPLPFGGMVERARMPFIATPLALCVFAALIRLYVTRDRTVRAQPTEPWRVWGIGALAFIVVVFIQLIPLPGFLLRMISPEAHALWDRASQIASIAGVPVHSMHPLTIDPASTVYEVFRLASIFAAFSTAAMVIRSHTRRVAMATILCAAAVFETLYGVREAALQRYAIWGWVNRLVFNRVTGTFVNPNHFAHYIAIILPMALFLAAVVWHRTGSRDLAFRRRLLHLLERQIILASFAVLATISCVAAILLAQSRGALLSLTAGILVVAAMIPGRRVARVLFGAAAGAVVLVALISCLGTERTVARFTPSESERTTLVGRRIGIGAALRIWKRFTIFGSGAGTFPRVESMEQHEDLRRSYNHAHDDYVEIAATTGTVGFVIALGTLIGGYLLLVQLTFGAEREQLTWRRRAFQTAALTSVSIAIVHALVDFNFFIAANPTTLAAIAGAAVAATDHDKRTRR